MNQLTLLADSYAPVMFGQKNKGQKPISKTWKGHKPIFKHIPSSGGAFIILKAAAICFH